MSSAHNKMYNVCVVVVFYNPTKEQILKYEYLANSIRVVAVDNSKNQSSVSNIEYIPLYSNKGIAAAQNEGIKYAIREGYEFVLLMDQDSNIDNAFVLDMMNEYNILKKLHPEIGFLGPVFVDAESDQEYKNYIGKGEDYAKVDNVIASGCLIQTETLKSVGGMDESLFIDLVDFEWGWRVVSNGYQGYMTRNVKMTHSIGKEYHNWHGFVLGISAPFRYFYQYRNTLWLCKRDYVPFRWKVKSILRRTLDLLLVPLVSKEGIKCFKFMTKGIKMGLFYKNTPLYQLYD